MVGDDKFGLAEWKKLMTDSLKYSVWNNAADKTKVWAEWEAQYVQFVYTIVKEFK